MVVSKVVNVRIMPKDIERIEKLIRDGYFSSVSDFIRTAAREHLNRSEAAET